MRRRKAPPVSEPEDELAYDWKGAMRFVRKIERDLHLVPDRARPQYAPPKIDPEDYIGFVPTPARAVRRMLELAELRRGDTLFDLGSGDGRILIGAARKYGARGVGIDIDQERIDDASRRAGKLLGRITFRKQNVFKTDLRAADAVTIYLLPALNEKLMPRLLKLRAGVRIVTHAFKLPGVAVDKRAEVKSSEGRQCVLYAYRTPLRMRDVSDE